MKGFCNNCKKIKCVDEYNNCFDCIKYSPYDVFKKCYFCEKYKRYINYDKNETNKYFKICGKCRDKLIEDDICWQCDGEGCGACEKTKISNKIINLT